MRGINLARIERKEAKGSNIGKLFIFPISVFLVVFVASLALIAYNLMLKNKLSSQNNDEAQIVKEMNLYTSKKVDILLVHERLQHIEKILSSRQTLFEKGIAIFDLVPREVLIRDLSLSENAITLNVSTSSLFYINELFDNVELFNEKLTSLKRATLSSFSVSPGFDNISASITFEL